ncbi:MAG TPA: hypothetical protein VKS44_16875, partial [Candidatus Acidoferrales bacterium]|nr:hypothetical protein [Candidatus Acidoferrales bacterium]
MKRLLSALLLFAYTAFAAPAGRHSAKQEEPEKFTIEQVLSAPFPTDLTPAPAKGLFAWVFNAEGKRNVWVAKPGSGRSGYSSRQLTNYSQ